MDSSPHGKTWLRGLRNDQLSGLMLVALALLIAWLNLAYPLGSLSEPGPGYMPLALALFLGAVGLAIALRGGASPLLHAVSWIEAPRAALIAAACAFGALALERVGYRITMMALLVFFLGAVERKGPLAVAAVAIGFSFATYFVFSTMLRVPLPGGPWGF